MSLSDIIIVYLALGAPIAVYHFFECENDTLRRNRLRRAAVLLLWPIMALQMLRRRLAGVPFSTEFDEASGLDAAIERKAAEIATSIKWHAVKSGAVYELRDVFDRYAALMSGAGSLSNAAELLRVAGRGDIGAGTNCLNRRNSARLARHQTDARRALLTAVEQAFETGVIPPDTVEKAAELAELLGDEATEISLREILNRQNYWTKPEGESWKSEPKPAQIETSPLELSTAATAASKSD